LQKHSDAKQTKLTVLPPHITEQRNEIKQNQTLEDQEFTTVVLKKRGQQPQRGVVGYFTRKNL